MQTNYFNFDLMIQNQANKDVLYNETIFKIDAFLNLSITGFIDSEPKSLNVLEKYVIAEGINKNKICYSKVYSDKVRSENIELFTPFEGMILYFITEQKFFIFLENIWQPLLKFDAISEYDSESGSHNKIESTYNQVEKVLHQSKQLNKPFFENVSNKFVPSNNIDFVYLYLNGDCQINLIKSNNAQLTFVVKQNYEVNYKLEWSSNIIWPEGSTHTITKTPNGIDIITLYKIPETEHFLAKIINQNYQY